MASGNRCSSNLKGNLRETDNLQRSSTCRNILGQLKNLCHSENLKDMSSLAGKAVIVTGSSSGIGLATAVLFAKKGANVTVCGRDVGRLQEAVKACEKAGKDAGHKNKIITSTGDISDSTVIKNTVEQTVKAFGGLDVLVTNHGANMLKGNESIEAWTRECFDTCMNTNVRSVIELVQQAVPHLEKNRGNVVCVSSLGSVSPMSQSLNYLISKAALDHAVRCLAMQLGAKGVRVNAINPTYVRTRLMRQADVGMQGMMDIVGTLYDREQPLRGQQSGPEEQAEVIAFLASDAARMVHGQCLLVDGGTFLKGQAPNFPALFEEFMQPQQ